MSRPDFGNVSLVLMALALYAVLALELLSALLAGLLIAELVQSAVRLLNRVGVADHRVGKAVALASVSTLIAVLIILGSIRLWYGLTAGPDNLGSLFEQMAVAIDTGRAHVPPWAKDYLPESVPELQLAASTWLRENAWDLRFVGRDVGLLIVHTIVGMIIGGMVAYSRGTRETEFGPLAEAMKERVVTLGNAFRDIVYSQVRISALNTVLTAIYLVAILPMFGIDLPFLKTMIVITFLVGLLPVIGNLISNTVIVLVSFSISPITAAASLLFLVVIHKLEYFVNAKIIGTRINARAWELLLAMMVMDAAFGIPGLIAAPIYWAYIKKELSQRGLI